MMKNVELKEYLKKKVKNMNVKIIEFFILYTNHFKWLSTLAPRKVIHAYKTVQPVLHSS